MKKLILILFLLPLVSFAQNSTGSQRAWHPASMQLSTPWSSEVSPENALPEYPRPQMVRSEWVNLNGLWDYVITDSTSYRPNNFDGKILVPYPIESALSGVKRALQPHEKLWYQRDFELSTKNPQKRYLLQFGAVDYQCTVLVNGKQVGSHIGGYQAFTIDITDAVQKGTNEILLTVIDPTDKGNNPKGKQVLNPKGIMYTATSGIWQTVWLEAVPRVYISGLKMTPDIDKGRLHLKIDIAGNPKDYTVEASSPGLNPVQISAASANIELAVPDPHLWSPDDPHLYDLKVKLLYKGKPIDEVSSYFGMRKIAITKDAEGQERIFLNNKYIFNLGVLDQGFWPDGLHTAPTDGALKFDVETIKAMGFNTIRKHIKIEPLRWYYWCDKLGMLVWQDMPYPANLSDEAKAEFTKESEENIKQLYNQPSIICWVLFNEGWHRFDQENMAAKMATWDTSRLINAHSGENYDRNAPRDDDKKWVGSSMSDIHDYPGPGIPPALTGKARVLGEWGGVRVSTPGHQWDPSKGWGYIESAKAAFAKKYELMMEHLKLFEEEGLSASIYTQPFDVEIEENGLMTYDRKVFKIPVDRLRAINFIMFNKK